jgi:putative glutamine amidotransferase
MAERIKRRSASFLWFTHSFLTAIILSEELFGMRPLIGIPCHAIIRAETGRPIYANNRAYVHAVESAGGVPILIPMLKDIDILNALLTRLDGLLLPGGIDLHPGRYGEAIHPLAEEADLELDEFEIILASWALQADIPVFGVCRGMQLINVALGGSLYQDISDQCPDSIAHSNRNLPRTHLSHRVAIEPGSRVEKVLGVQEVWVNSLHHQAVKTPGQGVRISGHAEDGIPELLEVPGYRFVMAAQCHPEEIYTIEPAFARLFSAFVQACSSIPGEAIDAEYSASNREIAVGAGQ